MAGSCVNARLITLVILFGMVPSGALAASDGFAPPVSGQITRSFGREPASGQAEAHPEVDYFAPAGTLVRAAGDGVVSSLRRAGSALLVTIDHGNRLQTSYSFSGKLKVVGLQPVGRGQVIGLSDNGQDPAGPILHFGATTNGAFLNPEQLLGDYEDLTALISLVPVQGVASSAAPASSPAAASVRETVPDLPPIGVPEVPKIAGFSDRRQASAWWAALSAGQQAELIKRDRARIAGLVGATEVKDTLNRQALQEQITLLSTELASAEERFNALKKGATWSPFGSEGSSFLIPTSVSGVIKATWAGFGLKRTRKRLGQARLLQDRLIKLPQASGRRLAGGDVFLMDFDLNFAGGDGRAVVALGDPAQAEYIGVLVPGMGSSLENFDGVLENAGNIRATIRDRIGPEIAGRSSTIAWLGYDSPDNFLVAGVKGKAKKGAAKLMSFVGQLRKENPEPARITLFGHSYGSTVIGVAGTRGVNADDLVLLGSPGAGGARSADGLGVGKKHVWVSRTDDDWIPYLRGLALLGKDPFPSGFGARYVPVDGNQKGHSSYFVLRSRGLTNLARIMTGQPQAVE